MVTQPLHPFLIYRYRYLLLAVVVSILTWHLFASGSSSTLPPLPFASLLDPLGTEPASSEWSSWRTSDTKGQSSKHRNGLIRHVNGYYMHRRRESFHVVLAGNDQPLAFDDTSDQMGANNTEALNARVDVCRTLFGSIVLNYPAPLILRGNDTETESSTGREEQRLRTVIELLRKGKGIQDGDLVLVLFGKRNWFQLPPEVLIGRWLRITSRRGMTKTTWRDKRRQDSMRKSTFVVAEDSVVDEILSPQNLSYWDSASMIGTVKDVKTVLEFVVESLESTSGTKTINSMEKSTGGKLIGANGLQTKHRPWWNAHHLAMSNAPWIFFNKTEAPNSHLKHITNDMAVIAPQITVNTAGDIFSILPLHSNLTNITMAGRNLPPDTFHARLPFPDRSNSTFANTETLSKAASTLIPQHPILDWLPSDLNWSTVALFMPKAGTIPPLVALPSSLSHNATTSLWKHTWFHPHARALLRHALIRPQPFIHARLGATQAPASGRTGEEAMRGWDYRGGRGGLWDGSTGRWQLWAELCRGVEEEVFGDGKGGWGEEVGAGRGLRNAWGSRIIEGRVAGER